MTRSKLAAFLLTSNNNIPGPSPRQYIVWRRCMTPILSPFCPSFVTPPTCPKSSRSVQRSSRMNGRSYTARPPAQCFRESVGDAHLRSTNGGSAFFLESQKGELETSSRVVPDASQYSGFVRGEREGRSVEWARTKPLATDKATTTRKVEDSFIVANNSIR